jgi:hypothetical protein
MVGILFLLFFAVKYGQNVVRYRHVQQEVAIMEGHIAEVEAKKEEVDRAFDESLAPAVVEDFAHQLGWGRPDDQIIVPVGIDANATMTAEQAEQAAAVRTIQPNWQLWLNLLRHER